MKSFDMEVQQRIVSNAGNEALVASARAFLQASTTPKYSYNFSWLGRPIIQYPQDVVAMQELIWRIRPDCCTWRKAARLDRISDSSLTGQWIIMTSM